MRRTGAAGRRGAGRPAREGAWARETPVAITVCDATGVLLEMNDRAAEDLASYGGRALVGKNIFACHPPPSNRKLARLLKSRRTNLYTIEKRGVRKLILQVPWFRGGAYAGHAELSVVLPKRIPHFVRTP
jgi:hypothetical protein